MDKLKKHLLLRAREASTWRGVVLVMTAAGYQLSEEQSEAIITVGLAIAGIMGALSSDHLSKKENL